MDYLTGTAGLPSAIALLVIVIEFAGAPALLVGLGGRLAALGVASVMVGAIATAHWSHGFFMNWAGTQAGEGFEYHILALALSGGIMIAGSGAFSVDRWLVRPSARVADPKMVGRRTTREERLAALR